MQGGIILASCLLVYYSDSGTTENLGKHIAKGLMSMNAKVDMANLSRQQPPDISTYDMLGIGSPVYFFSPVPAVKRYLYRISNINGLPVFTFLSYGTNLGKAPEKIWRILSTKGAVNIGVITCRNTDFISGVLNTDVTLSLDHINSEELHQAVEFGKKIGKLFNSEGSR